MKNPPVPAKHRFLKFILPAKAFDAVRKGTKLWLVECACGHRRDLWDLGGVRYKARGTVWRMGKCSSCGRWSMLKIYRPQAT